MGDWVIYLFIYFVHLPAPRVLYKKFQQDTNEEIPHEVLYCGRLMQYLGQKIDLAMYKSSPETMRSNCVLDICKSDASQKMRF